MNKFCLICASVACLSFFSSCNKSESENHCLWLIHPQNYNVLYADQVEDSVVFQTFDSYEARPYNTDWLTITAGESYTVTYNPYNLYTFKALLAFSPNTTGKTRIGRVQIDSYNNTCYPSYVQLGFLNINHPSPTIAGDDYIIPEAATFELQVEADAVSDSVCFTVANPWTLEFENGADQTWLTLGKTAGGKDYNNIAIALTPNTDKQNARTTALVLKSGEVSNVINIKQMPAKEQTNE